MADKYYLMSKDIGDGPYLIGEMLRLEPGEYRFRYLINGNRFPQWFMQMPGLRDISKTYGSRETLHMIIYRLVPQENSWEAGILMRQNGISEYDEWELLESLIEQHEYYKAHPAPLCDSHQLFYLYTEIPHHTNRFD